MAFRVGPARQAECAARVRTEQVRNRQAVTERLLAAYRAEPDRVYAEEFYGEMLRERGVDPS